MRATKGRGEELKISVGADLNLGSLQYHRAFARFTAPKFDIAEILPMDRVLEIIKQLEATKRYNRKLDIGLILAEFEREKNLQFVIDILHVEFYCAVFDSEFFAGTSVVVPIHYEL